MRAILIIIDSFGIGALPDADQYDDVEANTALHICQNIPNVQLNTLYKLGLGNCASLLGFELPGIPFNNKPMASYGVMAEKSPGKDTTTGHWEIAGIIISEPLQTFPPDYPSFPASLIDKFTKQIGKDILGNIAASGTEIINQLGKEHMETGFPIVYTSADSVFQMAAHDEIIPLQDLYSMCKTARILCNEFNIARIIARPFTGTPGNFTRTANRKDFSIALPSESVLDHLLKNNIETIGVGKIGNIFNEQGLKISYPVKGNKNCLEKTYELLLPNNTASSSFIFVNLVDTDMLFGHRRDTKGYYQELLHVDHWLEKIISRLSEDDLLIISADHGCDPTHKGTDHTREYVPLLVYHKKWAARNLQIRSSFADIAQSLAHYFKVPKIPNGVSFL